MKIYLLNYIFYPSLMTQGFDKYPYEAFYRDRNMWAVPSFELLVHLYPSDYGILVESFTRIFLDCMDH